MHRRDTDRERSQKEKFAKKTEEHSPGGSDGLSG